MSLLEDLSRAKGTKKGDSPDLAFVKTIIKFGVGAFALLVFFLTIAGSYQVVSPGNRGIAVTMGKSDTVFRSEGLNFKVPFITDIHEVSIRQQTSQVKASCFSSDLQQLGVDLSVLYHVPEAAVVTVFRDYAGSPFDSIIAPLVYESVKEVTALETAEGIAKKREDIKANTLETARRKLSKLAQEKGLPNLLIVDDIIITNINLSEELEKAIEAKMVQAQEAEKAKFIKMQAEISAETQIVKANADAQSVIIAAKAEADALNTKGEALRKNPGVVSLRIAERWDGKTPMVVGAGSGTNILLPVGKALGKDNN